MTAKTFLDLRLAPVAAALLAAFGSVHAAEGDLMSKMTSDSAIEVGVGYVDKDNGNFGKYNGLDEKGGNLLLDGDIRMRDEATGTWMRLYGRNLGLDNRALRWDYTRQGNFGYYLEYNEITRNEPLQIVTPVVGIGSGNLTLGATPVLVDLESKRKRYSLGFDKALAGNWGFNVDFRTETKKGERIDGRGSPYGGAANNFSFTPEPFDSTINQIDATARYTGTKFQVVGGYYGTQYRNDIKSIRWNYGNSGTGAANADLLSPSALPPDNQSHQLYVTGGYSFTPMTRGTFKVAYSVATQNDTFIEPSLSPRTDLGGKVETTLLQAGVSSRPMPKLSVTANLRYEDRNDKTPISQYFLGSGTASGQNEPRSLTNTSGKLEASYALPQGFRAIGAVEYEQKERNTYVLRSVAHRDETEEMSYRAELRRAMSETVTGGVSYTYSDRDGSAFYQYVAALATAPTPLHYADRKRDKVRFTVNWMPAEPLSLNFYADDISDKYNGIDTNTGIPMGPQKGKQRVYAVDAGYRINASWHVTAWYNFNEYEHNNRLAPPRSDSFISNKADSYGLGLRGKASDRMELGADFSYSDIVDEWLQAGAVPLPTAVTRLTRLKLFGKYDLDKKSGVRVDYIYDRFSSNDPTWTGWVAPNTGRYSDGTVISQPSPQTAHFVGIRYFYKFQ